MRETLFAFAALVGACCTDQPKLGVAACYNNNNNIHQSPKCCSHVSALYSRLCSPHTHTASWIHRHGLCTGALKRRWSQHLQRPVVQHQLCCSGHRWDPSVSSALSSLPHSIIQNTPCLSTVTPPCSLLHYPSVLSPPTCNAAAGTPVVGSGWWRLALRTRGPAG